MAAMTAQQTQSPRHTDIVIAAIDAMTGTITVARALVAAGRRVDLTGLDGEINVICTAAMTLPEAEGRALRPMLAALEQAVGDLAAALMAGETAP